MRGPGALATDFFAQLTSRLPLRKIAGFRAQFDQCFYTSRSGAAASSNLGFPASASFLCVSSISVDSISSEAEPTSALGVFLQDLAYCAIAVCLRLSERLSCEVGNPW